jgi:light-regulated signal transduction histidine kinase (bacteriophytochrome)
LNNAVKFTSKHSQAKIELGTITQKDGSLVYFVRDDGVGFDMNYADKLFSPFQRLHGMQEFQGNGIGLATVQRVVRRHSGQIWAEGAIEGGATFYFTLAAGEIS